MKLIATFFAFFLKFLYLCLFLICFRFVFLFKSFFLKLNYSPDSCLLFYIYIYLFGCICFLRIFVKKQTLLNLNVTLLNYLFIYLVVYRSCTFTWLCLKNLRIKIKCYTNCILWYSKLLSVSWKFLLNDQPTWL